MLVPPMPQSTTAGRVMPNGSRVSCGRLARRAQGRWTKSVPRQGHNTPLPLKRSPPASFKRLLGSPMSLPNAILQTVHACSVLRCVALAELPARTKSVGEARVTERELFHKRKVPIKVVFQQMLKNAGRECHPDLVIF